MHLELTEEQQLLRDSVRRFCEAEMGAEKLFGWAEEPTGLPEPVWARMAEQGWIDTMVPEAYGGLGLGVTELALIAEELGRALAPGPFFATAALAGPALALGGSDTQKEKWLPGLAAGRIRATVALLEEDGQLGPSYVRARASRQGRGYVLEGEKRLAPNLMGADIVIAALRTDDDPDEGTTLFLIETAAPGARVEPNRLTDITSRSGQLILDRVEVGPEAIVGEPGRGWAVIEPTLRIANVCLAGESVAGAEHVLKKTVAYAKERIQFGVPIGSFQAVKHPLANLFAEIESARSAYHYAAWVVDAGGEEAAAAVAVARLACTEAYRRTTLDCLQAHGGIGFTWEYDLHLYLKRAMHNCAFLGVSADYEESIARKALGI